VIGQSAATARRSGLFGWAGYGYCPSHSRWYWGSKLTLICTCEGTWAGSAWPTRSWPGSATRPGRCAKTRPPTGRRRHRHRHR